MNRMAVFLLAGVVIVALGVGGYYGFDYYNAERAKQNVNAKPAPNPMSWEDMEKLQVKGADAADEIPRLLDCFTLTDEALGIQAAETLGKIGPKAVQPVREKLKDKDGRVRFLAVQTLAFIGPDAKEAMPDILACIKDADANVRRKAIYAIAKVGGNDQAVFQTMIEAMADKDETVRTTAIESIDELGAPPREAVPALTKLATKDVDPATCAKVVQLLGKAGEPAAPALKELLKADGMDQAEVIRAIVLLGPGAKTLLPDLESIMIKNTNWPAQDALMVTFKKCGVDGAAGLTKVLKALQDPKAKIAAPDSRSKVLLKAIGEMGSDAKPAVPVLIVLLKDRENLRPEVLEALGGIGPTAKEAIPAVRGLLTTPAIEPQARVALKRMGVVE